MDLGVCNLAENFEPLSCSCVHVECSQRFLCKYCQNGLSGVTALASIFTWLIQRGYMAVVWSGVDKQAALIHSRRWNYSSGLAYFL